MFVKPRDGFRGQGDGKQWGSRETRDGEVELYELSEDLSDGEIEELKAQARKKKAAKRRQEEDRARPRAVEVRL